jgi:hypothetical protein
MSAEKGAIIGVMICCALVFSTVDIAAVVIGAKNAQSLEPPTSGEWSTGIEPAWAEPCQSDDVSFTLGTWLVVSGVTNLIATAISITVAALAIGCEIGELLFCSIPVALLSGLFKLAWFVVGIVILATLPNGDYDCSQQYKDVWIMSIVQVIFLGLGMLNNCLNAGGSSTAE